MKRYYLKATGAACYSPKGITFPNKQEINLIELISNHGGMNIRKAYEHGFSNQPLVLTFDIHGEGQTRPISNHESLRLSLIRLNLPLIISEHWLNK